MMPGHEPPIMAEKNDSAENIQKSASWIIPALFVTLAVIALLASGKYWPWVESLELPSWIELPSWFVLPAMIALWGIVLSRSVQLFPRPGGYRAEIPPSPDLLQELRRERLRADRSRRPLSIALFCLGGERSGEALDIQRQQFIAVLRSAVRETDIVGNFGDGRVGVLLTDTDAKGRDAFIRKLLDRRGDIPFSIVARTYPDQTFDGLVEENPRLIEPHLFYSDISTCRHRFGYSSKRWLDIIGALVGIALFSPLMLLTAVAVKLTSPGPIIFRQIRLGEKGQPFVFYKFRSMAVNTDDRIHRAYVESLISGDVKAINQGSAEAPLYKIKADPRVTPIGRIIRRTSIDELPQFFNVLKGEMSLVGPRPPLPYEAEKYQSWHMRRIFEMKPGITGIWQVEGRSRTSFDEMVRLDLEYMRRCSLALDLKILLKTVKVVLRGVGAA